MGPERVVRDAVAGSDAGACAAIYATYVTGTVTTFETVPPSAAVMAERITAAQDRHVWLVLEEAGRLTGYAYGGPFKARAAYDWSCEVSVYLHPDLCRGGRGRLLYTALLERLTARGYRRAAAGVTQPNPASDGLHQALGFVHVGTHPRIGWKSGAWHDVAWYQRDLAGADDPPAPLG